MSKVLLCPQRDYHATSVAHFCTAVLKSLSVSDLELLAAGQLEPVGNNWPPIISLPGAENYSFEIGSAQLTENFKTQLSDEISPFPIIV